MSKGGIKMKKVSVDKSQCIGCGFCMSQAPEVFEFDEDGLSKAKVEQVADDSQAVVAAEGCPTGAIEIEDENEEDN